VTHVLRVDPVHPDIQLIAKAADCLRAGGLVAFPTETVYGLGAHALDPDAVARVFQAKGRPANDPLIVHVATLDAARPLVADLPRTAQDLAARFWPGPLTLVLRRSPLVPDEVTAGLDTVAIRIPSHPVARALLDACGLPLAAPSANLFSRPSPTQAAHVLADLAGRIDIVVDGGPTDVGVESTVVDLTTRPPMVLRPGVVDLDALRSVIPDVGTRQAAASDADPLRAPGMMARHYSPVTPVLLFDGERDTTLARLTGAARDRIARGESVIVLAFDEDRPEFRPLHVHLVELGPEGDPPAVAARLYAALREADQAHASVILVRGISTRHPLSAAIQDRLRRAATS